MAVNESDSLRQVQRILVGIEGDAASKRLRISVESYTDGLGWYAAGSLSFPIHQLPLLEQALAELRHLDEGTSSSPGDVIPFPGLRTIPPC